VVVAIVTLHYDVGRGSAYVELMHQCFAHIAEPEQVVLNPIFLRLASEFHARAGGKRGGWESAGRGGGLSSFYGMRHLCFTLKNEEKKNHFLAEVSLTTHNTFAVGGVGLEVLGCFR